MWRKRSATAASGAAGILPAGGRMLSDRLVIRGPDQNYSEAYTAQPRLFICLCNDCREKGSMDRMREQFRVIQRKMQATTLLAHIAQRTINSATCTRLRSSSKYLRRGNGRNIRLFLVGAWLSPQGAFQALRCAHNANVIPHNRRSSCQLC